MQVRRLADARPRYERLLGSEPALCPDDVEAVPPVEAIRRRGIEPTEFEDHGDARKDAFNDLDGNEIGMGQVPPA